MKVEQITSHNHNEVVELQLPHFCRNLVLFRNLGQLTTVVEQSEVNLFAMCFRFNSRAICGVDGS
jgi:hypothetical protein